MTPGRNNRFVEYVDRMINGWTGMQFSSPALGTAVLGDQMPKTIVSLKTNYGIGGAFCTNHSKIESIEVSFSLALAGEQSIIKQDLCSQANSYLAPGYSPFRLTQMRLATSKTQALPTALSDKEFVQLDFYADSRCAANQVVRRLVVRQGACIQWSHNSEERAKFNSFPQFDPSAEPLSRNALFIRVSPLAPEKLAVSVFTDSTCTKPIATRQMSRDQCMNTMKWSAFNSQGPLTQNFKPVSAVYQAISGAAFAVKRHVVHGCDQLAGECKQIWPGTKTIDLSRSYRVRRGDFSAESPVRASKSTVNIFTIQLYRDGCALDAFKIGEIALSQDFWQKSQEMCLAVSNEDVFYARNNGADNGIEVGWLKRENVISNSSAIAFPCSLRDKKTSIKSLYEEVLRVRAVSYGSCIRGDLYAFRVFKFETPQQMNMFDLDGFN